MEKGKQETKKNWNKDLWLVFNPQPKTMEHGCHSMVENLPSEAMSSNLSTSQRHERLWDKSRSPQNNQSAMHRKKSGPQMVEWSMGSGMELTREGGLSRSLGDRQKTPFLERPWVGPAPGFWPIFHMAVRILLKFQSDYVTLFPVKNIQWLPSSAY